MTSRNDYSKIPDYTLGALQRYVDHGIPPGSFLTAVLENNLRAAFACADENNAEALRYIVAYCYWEIPGNCWGSPEAVQVWIQHKEDAPRSAALRNGGAMRSAYFGPAHIGERVTIYRHPRVGGDVEGEAEIVSLYRYEGMHQGQEQWGAVVKFINDPEEDEHIRTILLPARKGT